MTIVSVLLLGLFIYLVYNFGQLLMAILFGIHNEHYFLGFNPRLFDFKIKDIKVSLGIYLPIFPLERIYKIENGEKVRMDLSWQFVTFPIWKRALVSLGGVFSLLIASIIIFTIITYTQSEHYYSKDEINKLGIYPSELAVKAGFEKGDRIELLNGKSFENFNEISVPKEGNRYTIKRDEKIIEVTISKDVYQSIIENHDLFIEPLMPFEIKEVIPNSPADKAEIYTGDKIIKVNDQPINTFQEFRYEIDKNASNDFELTVLNKTGDQRKVIFILDKTNQNKSIGIIPEIKLNWSERKNSLFESIVKGFQLPFTLMYNNIKDIIKIFRGELVSSHGGPIHLSKELTGHDYWFKFWNLTGLFCAITVLLNLLPLPRSAFSQLLPLAYEGITGKILSFKTYSYIRKAPYLLLILLLAIAFINDIYHTFYR